MYTHIRNTCKQDCVEQKILIVPVWVYAHLVIININCKVTNQRISVCDPSLSYWHCFQLPPCCSSITEIPQIPLWLLGSVCGICHPNISAGPICPPPRGDGDGATLGCIRLDILLGSQLSPEFNCNAFTPVLARFRSCGFRDRRGHGFLGLGDASTISVHQCVCLPGTPRWGLSFIIFRGHSGGSIVVGDAWILMCYVLMTYMWWFYDLCYTFVAYYSF